MNPLLVSGDVITHKASSIAFKLAGELNTNIDIFNGKLPGLDGTNADVSGYDLILWMPNIPNDLPTYRPVKDKGAILIISKVIHGDRTEIDAVSRIFEFGANAVLCIYKDNPKKMSFRLIDALGNTWAGTSDLSLLANQIHRFYEWSRGQVRISYAHSSGIVKPHVELSEKLIEVNSCLANKVQSSMGIRYFGNFSTRCMKLFPTSRIETQPNTYLVSPRNVDKHYIRKDDFVMVGPPWYYGDRKYSVDTPIQVALYQQFSDINFMIHGHATIKGAKTTKEYYPCGDLREVEGVAKLFRQGHRTVNLLNHGFLIATDSLDKLASLSLNTLEFDTPNLFRDTHVL